LIWQGTHWETGAAERTRRSEKSELGAEIGDRNGKAVRMTSDPPVCRANYYLANWIYAANPKNTACA
jgi:hypothetical protein